MKSLKNVNSIRKQLFLAEISKRISMNHENSLKHDLTVFFQKLCDEVMENFEVYYNTRLLLQGQVNIIVSPISESQEEYYSILKKYNKKEYQQGRKKGQRLVEYAIHANKSIGYNVKIKKDQLFGTIKFSEQQLLNGSFIASKNTMKRVESNINKILVDGYIDGLGISKVRNNILKRFGQLKSWEATRIARTEIHNAHNMGVMNIYQELDVEYTQWISASDGRTRSSHAELDGEIIPFGGTYSNGCQYPGDTRGPIEEWINCRCSNAPFIIPYGYIAPPGGNPFRESDLIKISEYASQNVLLNNIDSDELLLNFKEIVPRRDSPLSLKLNNKIIKNAKVVDPSINMDKLLDKIPELNKMMSLAAYHELNSAGEIEYLTMLTKDGRLIADVFKGKKGETRFPESVLKEPIENILFSLHNHRYGAIIPSGNDIHNVIYPNIKFTGIVSESNFGLIVNENKKNSKSKIKDIENNFLLFEMYVTYCFDIECNNQIKKLKSSSSSKKEFKERDSILLDKYLSKNNSRFVEEFNDRMKNFNIKLIQIKLKEGNL